MTVRFEAAGEADFERLLALRLVVMRPHLERIGRFDPDRARARFRGSFDPAHIRLVRADGAEAGCVSLKPHPQGLEIEHFYLHPEFQGRGVGAEVMTLLLAEADAAGLAVHLGVLRLSEAARFYERHGFRRTGADEWDVFYRRDPQRLPA